MANNYRVLRHFKAGGKMRKPGDLIDVTADGGNDWRNLQALVDQRYLAPAGDDATQSVGGSGPTPDPKIAQDRAVEAAAGREVLATNDVAADDTALDKTEGATVTEEEGKALKGKLPEDFPGHAALVAADLDTYAKVRRHLDTIEEVDGIAEKTGEKIRAAFGVAPKNAAGTDEAADETAANAAGSTAGTTGEPGDSTVPKAPNA